MHSNRSWAYFLFVLGLGGNAAGQNFHRTNGEGKRTTSSQLVFNNFFGSYLAAHDQCAMNAIAFHSISFLTLSL
jgi:hypothetical protein